MSERRLYICECCEEEFETIHSISEAEKEAEDLFPEIDTDEAAIVCEPCFIKIMDFKEPEQYRYSKYIRKN